MKYSPQDIGKLIRDTRKRLGVTQRDLALTSGTGLRFVIDLEKGKETCQIGKALTILNTLGIKVTLTHRPVPSKEGKRMATTLNADLSNTLPGQLILEDGGQT